MVTLNPGGEHGIAISQQDPRLASTRRMPVGSGASAKSTKSLRDLLSGARRKSQQTSFTAAVSGKKLTRMTRGADETMNSGVE